MEYDNYDGYERYEEPAPPRKKKKRSKVARFFRALGMYFAEMPAQTLILIGGSVVVVLIAVILLVVLLPKKAGNAGANDPAQQLGIVDAATPTPSLAPIVTPDPVSVTPEPESSPTTSSATLAKALELWMEDPVVAEIQTRLIELNYMEMPDGGVTYKYGPATKNAIRRFQQKNIENYKEWDGICGQATYDLLMAASAKAFYFSKGDTDDSLYDGARVTALQTRLIHLGYFTGKTTGTYGNETVAAVKAFQEANGLIADGIAGAATLTVINGATAIDAATAAANKAAGITPYPIQTAAATTTDGAAPETPDPNASTSPNP